MRGYFQDAIKEYLIEKGQVTEGAFQLHKGILTLEQFIELALRQQDHFKNIHWDSYSNLCSPCDFKYDLIIKLESLKDDVPARYDYIQSVNSSASLPEISPQKHTRVEDKNANRLLLVSEMMEDMNQEVITNITEL